MARNAASAACVASVACTGASAAGAASGSAAVMARASASAPWSRMRFKAVSPVENRHPSGALCAADVAKVRGFPASTRSQREEVARAAKIQALTRRFAPPSPAERERGCSGLASVAGAAAVPAAVADIQLLAVGGGEGGEQFLHDAHPVLLVGEHKVAQLHRPPP